MCDVDVRENDILVVHRTQQPVEGALVVAVVLDRMLVVRRFFGEDERVRLDPSGGSLQPLRMPRTEVQVHGIVVALLRQYAAD